MKNNKSAIRIDEKNDLKNFLEMVKSETSFLKNIKKLTTINEQIKETNTPLDSEIIRIIEEITKIRQ